MRSLRKNNKSDNIVTKSKQFYTDLEGEEKGCSCEVKEVCYIF